MTLLNIIAIRWPELVIDMCHTIVCLFVYMMSHYNVKKSDTVTRCERGVQHAALCRTAFGLLEEDCSEAPPEE